MSAEMATDLNIAISSEAQSLAAAKGWEPYIQNVLDMTRRLFPGARRVRVFVEADGEIPDFAYVVFEVLVNGATREQVLAADRQWTRELGGCCPMPWEYPFVLSLQFDDP